MGSIQAGKIVVGVDGSDASIEALRQAQVLATALGALLEATACWESPRMHEGYALMGIERFEERAGQILDDAVTEALGTPTPGNVIKRLVNGAPRSSLLKASDDADLLVVGRRGHGGFTGLLLGSVSSACVSYANCPVLVVHAPGTNTKP